MNQNYGLTTWGKKGGQVTIETSDALIIPAGVAHKDFRAENAVAFIAALIQTAGIMIQAMVKRTSTRKQTNTLLPYRW